MKKDVKFNCASCGQHIQCDESLVGEQLPCPGCAVLIRVPKNATVVAKNPKAPAAASENVPTLEDNFRAQSGAAVPGGAPLTEREQQLAAARAEHAAHASHGVKPRLSFILSGGQAPPSKENEEVWNNPDLESKRNEAHHSNENQEVLHYEDQKHPKPPPPDDTKTVQE